MLHRTLSFILPSDNKNDNNLLFKKTSLLIFLYAVLVTFNSHAQSVINADGSPFMTTYCNMHDVIEIAGQPSGGQFSGCGVYLQSGRWYFSPAVATAGLAVFPYQCILTYTVGGSTTTTSVLIQKPVVINPALQDTFTCNGQFRLNATMLYAGNYDYAWSPAVYLDQPDAALTKGNITHTTTFTVWAKDVVSGCTGTDTMQVKVIAPPVLVVSPDTIILPPSVVRLSVSGAQRYEWYPRQWLDNPFSANPMAKPETSVVYTVRGYNEYGCSSSDSISINLMDDIFIPNAFSPNGDGVNDVFRIRNFGYQEILAYSIYNRWGARIFNTMDGFKGWDGLYNGKPADAGNYHYFIELKLKNGKQKIMKGIVSLIR